MPSVHASEESYLPSVVPVSATLWFVPVGTVTVALAPSPPLTAVVPLTLRSNVPLSFAGIRPLTTLIVPVLRVLVNVQVTVSPAASLIADTAEPSLQSQLRRPFRCSKR